MSYQCSQCQYAFDSFEEEAVGPFCDCPQCGGLAVEAQSTAAPVAAGRDPDPFAQPSAASAPLMGSTGAQALSPGLFDNYFAEAASSGVAPAPAPAATPFDNVEDEPLATGDIHREPTMLLSDERSVASVAPASSDEISLPSAATPSVDPYAFAQEAFAPLPDDAQVLDPMQTQQGRLAPREVTGVRDVHDEMTNLAGAQAPAPVALADRPGDDEDPADSDARDDPFAEVSDPGARPPDASLGLYGDDDAALDDDDDATWVEPQPEPWGQAPPEPDGDSDPQVAAAAFDQELIATLPRPPGAELSDPRRPAPREQAPFASLLSGELPRPGHAADADADARLPSPRETSAPVSQGQASGDDQAQQSWTGSMLVAAGEQDAPTATAGGDREGGESSAEAQASVEPEAPPESFSGQMLVSGDVLRQGEDVDGQMLVEASADGAEREVGAPAATEPVDVDDARQDPLEASMPALVKPPPSALDTQELPTRSARARGKKAGVSSSARGSSRRTSKRHLLSGSFFFVVVLVAAVMGALGLVGGYWLTDSGRKAAPLTGPARARLLLGQGHKLLHENSDSEALKALQQALRNDPTLPEIQRALGTAYGRLGKTDKAAKAYRTYVKLAPNARDAEAIRQMLARHLGQAAP